MMYRSISVHVMSGRTGDAPRLAAARSVPPAAAATWAGHQQGPASTGGRRALGTGRAPRLRAPRGTRHVASAALDRAARSWGRDWASRRSAAALVGASRASRPARSTSSRARRTRSGCVRVHCTSARGSRRTTAPPSTASRRRRWPGRCSTSRRSARPPDAGEGSPTSIPTVQSGRSTMRSFASSPPSMSSPRSSPPSASRGDREPGACARSSTTAAPATSSPRACSKICSWPSSPQLVFRSPLANAPSAATTWSAGWTSSTRPSAW